MLRPVLAAAALAALASLPAQAADDEIDLDQLSPWGTELDVNNVDPALLGSWRMVKGEVHAGNNVLEMRANGRRLSILNSGSFREDYSTEGSEIKPGEIYQGQVFGAGVDRYAPRGTCKMQGSGEIIGHMTQHYEMDLDKDPPIVGAMTMHVALNPAASTKPEVACKDRPDKKIGNMVTPPLGYGFTRTGASGPYVEYYYSVYGLVIPGDPPTIIDHFGLHIWSTPSVAPTVHYWYVRG